MDDIQQPEDEGHNASYWIEFITYIVKHLVDNPDAVSAEIKDGHTLILKVDKPDMGKVIGREGLTVRALRTILQAATHKEFQLDKSSARISLEMFDDERPPREGRPSRDRRGNNRPPRNNSIEEQTPPAADDDSF